MTSFPENTFSAHLRFFGCFSQIRPSYILLSQIQFCSFDVSSVEHIAHIGGVEERGKRASVMQSCVRHLSETSECAGSAQHVETL